MVGIAATAAERQREGTEWSITYAFNANETAKPRVLLIGDSICNGYQAFVKEELDSVAYTSFWATSKCVTDRSYIKELSFILDEYPYAVIHFNNGLHSLDTDRVAWEASLREVIKVLKEKGKGAKVIWATSTPLKDPALTAKAKELNAIAARVIAEAGIPTDDLFGLMDPQDRATVWSDVFHYHEPGRRMQAKQVANEVKKLLPAPEAPKPAGP
jgi:lysophospholipase L1-like esterase